MLNGTPTAIDVELKQIRSSGLAGIGFPVTVIEHTNTHRMASERPLAILASVFTPQPLQTYPVRITWMMRLLSRMW